MWGAIFHLAAQYSSRVIDVQMRVDNEVDLLRLNARITQPVQKWNGLMVEYRIAGPFLIVTGARVDEDDMVRRPDEPGMDAHDEGISVLVHIDQCQSWLQRLDLFGFGSWIQEGRWNMMQVLLLHLPNRRAGNMILFPKIAHGTSPIELN